MLSWSRAGVAKISPLTEFVRLYTSFLLDTSISSQFSAFSAGFSEVTSGNSLSLFKGEELELLVRGSDEQLDVEQLKGVTVYQGWSEQDETVQCVQFCSLVSHRC